MLFIIYSNQNDNAKWYKSRRYYLPKVAMKNYNMISNGKYFFDQPIDFDTKWYERIRKSLTGKSEIYTTECLLDDDCLKNHYRWMAVYWSRQNELDANPEAIQEIEFVTIKHPKHAMFADKSMFLLTILEKKK